MAGHSKWANIQHRKNAQDAKRGQIFTKLIREITVAARRGEDPATNARLRLAIDKASAANMAKETLDRAIKRGAGGLEGSELEEIRYEGYGPNGVAILVDALSNNRNRTAAEVRHAFAKWDGNLGTPGSVAYLFNKKGFLTFAPGLDEITILSVTAAEGIEDIRTHTDGSIDVISSEEDFPKLQVVFTQHQLKPVQAEITWLASTVVSVTNKEAEKIEGLIEALESLEDVQSVYTQWISKVG